MKSDENNRLSIAEEAAEWFVRLPAATPLERREFLQWLRRSPQHVTELLQIAAWDEAVSDAFRKSRLDAEALIEQAGRNVIELDANAQHAARRPRDNPWRWRVAAGIAAVALSSLLFFAARIVWLDGGIETQASEWRSVPLTDGTVIQAGPNSELSFDFRKDVRLLHFTRGEVLLKVAQDRRRPFTVRTDVADIRATGTQFAVARRGQQIVVTVVEGTVVVAQGEFEARDAALKSSPENVAGVVATTLGAGEQLTVSPSEPLLAHAVDTKIELAWAQGQLIFAGGSTLADAVREFNLRNRTQMVIDDPALATTPIRGSFDAADPRSFAATLAVTQILSVRGEANTLHLSRTAPAPVVGDEPRVER